LRLKILQVQTVFAQLQTKAGVMDVLNDGELGMTNGAMFNRRKWIRTKINRYFIFGLIGSFSIHFRFKLAEVLQGNTKSNPKYSRCAKAVI